MLMGPSADERVHVDPKPLGGLQSPRGEATPGESGPRGPAGGESGLRALLRGGNGRTAPEEPNLGAEEHEQPLLGRTLPLVSRARFHWTTYILIFLQ